MERGENEVRDRPNKFALTRSWNQACRIRLHSKILQCSQFQMRATLCRNETGHVCQEPWGRCCLPFTKALHRLLDQTMLLPVFIESLRCVKAPPLNCTACHWEIYCLLSLLCGDGGGGKAGYTHTRLSLCACAQPEGGKSSPQPQGCWIFPAAPSCLLCCNLWKLVSDVGLFLLPQGPTNWRRQSCSEGRRRDREGEVRSRGTRRVWRGQKEKKA